MEFRSLIDKYDVPVPRYTSYPTVPCWTDTPSRERWCESLARAGKSTGWSLYLHIPFCETLCTYCGCNNTITKDHSRGIPYAERILKEWSLYRNEAPSLTEKPLEHIHLGGGTPTFLSPLELERLLKPILSSVKIKRESFHASIEVDPRRTGVEQLKVLRELGFRRISMGVQDFDPEVQRLMNRIQPEELTRNLTEQARSMGYSSVNYDLIYGLARQSLESMRLTAEKTIALRPDRIALYSLAIVPWIKPAQRLFKDEDLPSPALKRQIYELARGMLLGAGYLEIGMDHFALPHDPLAKALEAKTLHRNFMGYTETRTDVLLGLGVSAISETPDCFHQNEKVLALYEQKVDKGLIPTYRGHILSEEDRAVREQILKFMTLGEVRFRDGEQERDARDFLEDMLADGLVRIEGGSLLLTGKGRPFLRNACAFFDVRLRGRKSDTRVFSRSI